jgi:hypothetical protein
MTDEKVNLLQPKQGKVTQNYSDTRQGVKRILVRVFSIPFYLFFQIVFTNTRLNFDQW